MPNPLKRLSLARRAACRLALLFTLWLASFPVITPPVSRATLAGPHATATTGKVREVVRLDAAPRVGGDARPMPDSATREPDAATRGKVSEQYGRLPLSFEANEGQAGRDARFVARGGGYTMLLSSRDFVLSLRRPASEGRKLKSVAVRMRLVGGNAAPRAAGLDELEGKSNYFIGNDPRKWLTDIQTYARVRVEQVYAGVDLVYYGRQGQLEYDFVVAPRADPRAIRLAFDGAQALSVDAASGDLLLRVAGGELRQHKPVVYQETADGARQLVEGRYVLKGKRVIGFEIGDYDAGRTLVIDPVLSYSTYLGGSGTEEGNDIAVDAAGNAYITGATSSTNFPTANPFQPSPGGSFSTDAFVTKLNAAGNGVVYSTYYGGSNEDVGYGIALDSSNNAYVTGATKSSNLPGVNGLKTSHPNNVFDAFVLKLSAAGNAVVYSTYLGGEASTCGVIIIIGDDGAGTDKGLDIAVDSQGSAVVTGYTHACDFPTTSPQPAIFKRNAFVSKLNPAGTALVYSMRLGGNDVDAGYGVAVDASDNAYVTGETFSVDFPVVSPFQQSNAARLAFKTTNGGAAWTTLNSGVTTTFGSPVTAAAVDPSMPSTIYAGTFDRGLFKSLDNGATWTPANNGFCCPPSFFREVTDIVIDPSSPSTVYVGTRFSGVFKSTNGGSTWSEANTNIGSSKDVLVLAIDPTSPSTLYAGLGFGQGVYQTTNGGANWTAANTGLPGSQSVVALAVDPSAPLNVYAATSNGVFKTTTGGAGWNPSGTGLTNPIFAFAIDPSSPAVVYAVGASGLFKSTNGGGNWTPKTTGLPNFNLDDAISLAIDPTSPSTLYVGFISNGVFKTVNGADNWTPMSTGLSGSSLAVNDMAVNPAAPSTIYAGTDGGVYKSINGAGNWAFSSTVVLGEREITVIAVDPANASIVYAGTDGGGVQKSTDGGATWSAVNNGLTGLSLDVDAIAIDPVTPSTVYAGTVNGVFKSTNGGASWAEKNSGFNVRNTNGLAIDPTNTQIIYAALFGSGVYKSINGGDSWTPHNNGLAGALGVHGVTIDPSNTQVVYAGTTNNVYKSTDGGASWIVRNTNMGGADETQALVVDPTNSMIVYAATDIGVYKTTNAANSWSFTFGLSAFVYALAIDHTSPQTLYAATDKGIFKTTDGASTWTQLTSGLSGVEAVALALARSSPSTVYAAFLPTNDAFVTKLSPTGTILYSTYLGGSGTDMGLGVAASADGRAHITGQTNSPNFPIASALQSTPGGLFDAFAAKLNAAGSALSFSTYLGGAGYDRGLGVAVDPSGNVYLTGGTNSPGFPTLNAVQNTFRGGGFIDPFRGDAFISKLTPAGTALFYSTFHGGTGYDAGTRVAADSAGSAYVVGITESTNFPVVSAFQPAIGSTFLKDAFVSKIIDDTGPPTPTTVQFTASSYNVSETQGSIQINVTRAGNTTGAVAVSYATTNGSATDTSDYTAALGTLHFAPGETEKGFTLFITNDVFVESPESLNLALSQPTGGATLDAPSAATVQITSDDTTPPTPSTNPINDATFFVRQHYRDFLNRDPDAGGLQFWVNQMTNCGNPDLLVCRINVSAAFFLSIEFQETGYLVYRAYGAAFGTTRINDKVPLTLRELLPDGQQIGLGVVVGTPGWPERLEANKQAYFNQFVLRPDFQARYPAAMTVAAFVDALNANTGGALSQAERNALVGGSFTRAQILRAVAEDQQFRDGEFNRAFVLMQYIGYLRRNPNDPPDTGFGGYNFWLNKLNQFGGNFINAEMVKAFIESIEYKGRFGPP